MDGEKEPRRHLKDAQCLVLYLFLIVNGRDLSAWANRDITATMENSDEQAWCDGQRSAVIDYLMRQGVAHGEVGDWPAWHIQPYVAVWAVESVVKPGWVG